MLHSLPSLLCFHLHTTSKKSCQWIPYRTDSLARHLSLWVKNDSVKIHMKENKKLKTLFTHLHFICFAFGLQYWINQCFSERFLGLWSATPLETDWNWIWTSRTCLFDVILWSMCPQFDHHALINCAIVTNPKTHLSIMPSKDCFILPSVFLWLPSGECFHCGKCALSIIFF